MKTLLYDDIIINDVKILLFQIFLQNIEVFLNKVKIFSKIRLF